ncbi:MAG: hypothetical protein P0Y53_00965 [Candidatus Pseudobacter hemicellulosilyticus]|uniref:Right handed beta helix domain-containing protein n=1 Tax=Candidatus Pseudobacter hemicellulosilyticus TaxID=3121375 RepID=A0AAJ5WSV5_9BACT|nr:MAG: hypothetical protein P0Y53_00965 [Pseudobacter sp.]
MLRKNFTLFASILLLSLSAQAKIWRVNNNAGVTADFTSFYDALVSTQVVNGDTVHIEPSATAYNSGTVTKRLVVIGGGYLLDPAADGNSGLQVFTANSWINGITIGNGGNGSKFMGIGLPNVVFQVSASAYNVVFERCLINSGMYFNAGAHDGITVRKCFFSSARIEHTSGTLENFTCENNIFYSYWAYINITTFTGSNNIIRNNSFRDVGAGCTIVNGYVANNIFQTSNCVLTNSVVKNNLFSSNQTLSGSATDNQVNVNMANVYVGGTTGGLDARTQLKSGSPAIGAGLTVGAVTSPDCGAFGATDPYKLSGIPAVPSIYSLTVPTSIASGANTMNVTISTRNNN